VCVGLIKGAVLGGSGVGCMVGAKHPDMKNANDNKRIFFKD
jgi:hypothetical protein